MNRQLSLVLGALAIVTTTASSRDAEAGGGRFGGARVHVGGGARMSSGGGPRASFGGGVSVGGGPRASAGGGARWSGGVSVGTVPRHARSSWRPHWNGGPSIGVGVRPVVWPRPYYGFYPGYYYPSYYGYSGYYQSTVPSYYQTTTVYPGEQGPVAAPGMVAMSAPRQPLPRFGIGLFAGGSAVEAQDGGSMHESDDVGVLGRFRLTQGLIVEGELGRTSFDDGNVDNVRVDRRVGASLVYEIGSLNRLAPYVLAGTGVQQAEVLGAYESTQNFAEIGVGVRYAVSRELHLAFDVRAGSRATISETTALPAGTTARTISPPSTADASSEEYTRARASAVLYF